VGERVYDEFAFDLLDRMTDEMRHDLIESHGLM
jgi:hypothetical protein